MTIPKILSNGWFWLAIAVPIIAIHYFFGKPPQPRKINPFFEKHKRTIARTGDAFLILVILLGWVPLIYMSISMSVESVCKYTHIPTNILLTSSVTFFAIGATALSGGSGVLLGLLSVFQSNLTKRKRLILLAVSVLPICFTILAILAIRFESPQIITEKSQAIWSMVKMGLMALVTCWIFNGPAIIMGRHFIRVAWDIMRKLRWVYEDYPG